MGFFSNEFASTLQYFTFPLEVVGLMLAAIEVRSPTIAAAITSSIKDFVTPRYEKMLKDLQDEHTAIFLGKQIRSMISQVQKKPEFLPFWFSYRTHKLLQSASLLLVIAGLAVLLAPMFLNHYAVEIHDTLGLWLFIVGIGLFAMSMLDLALGWVAFYADRFVKGRAVGTLGIIIAGFGVLGEGYQFTTQLVI